MYDLAADLGETANLAGARTNELKQLDSTVDAWNKQLIPPVFSGLTGHQQPPAEP